MQISTARDFYAKLELEHRDVVADLTDHRPAVNAALTAWHLREWVWNEIKGEWDLIRAAFPESEAAFKDRSAFLDWTQAECPALLQMREIANGAKHLAKTGLVDHRGGFDAGFDRSDFDVSRLRVRGEGLSDTYFDEYDIVGNFDQLLDGVVDWWGRSFDRLGEVR